MILKALIARAFLENGNYMRMFYIWILLLSISVNRINGADQDEKVGLLFMEDTDERCHPLVTAAALAAAVAFVNVLNITTNESTQKKELSEKTKKE